MLAQFVQPLSLWISLSLLVAAAGSVAMGEVPVRGDEGGVDGVENFRAPDDKRVNGKARIGGVIGHQIGSGRGNAATTVAGAIGGAVIGYEIEKGGGKRRDAASRCASIQEVR